MGKLIVNYGSYQEKYSSKKLEKLIVGEFKAKALINVEYNMVFQHFLSKEGVASLEFQDMELGNLKLQGGKKVSFVNCYFEGTVDLEDFSSLTFEDCFMCRDHFIIDQQLLLLADQIFVQDGNLEFDRGSIMATEKLSLCESKLGTTVSDLTLTTPCLVWKDNNISGDLTWNVGKVIGSLNENSFFTYDIEYLGLPLKMNGEDFRTLLNRATQMEDYTAKFTSYHQFMRIARFLEGRGYSLISHIQTIETAREYQNHLQGVDETNFQEVFSALEHPCSMSSKRELEKETIPQLVKRMKREN